MLTRRNFIGSLGLLATAPAITAAWAQDYPSKTIRIVVPTNPGSPFDIPSRVIATELTNNEGWRTVVHRSGRCPEATH